MTTVITVYDLPDEAAAPTALGDEHTLHRAVGEPAAYRWIDVGESVTPDQAALVVAEASGRPGALSGRYDAFHVNDHAAEVFDPSRQGEGVIFVNCMRFAPEQHDAAFAAWERVNRYMVGKPGYRWHRLHRRLDDDAPFGLVNVVEWESPDAWRAAHDAGFRALTEGDLPFTALPTLVSTGRGFAGGGPMISPDARTAGTGADTSGPVTLINSFRVPVERDDDFHALWETTSHYFTRQPGFVSLRLHRAVSDDATYRWVNVAQWDSEVAFRAAHATEEFRAVVTAEGWEDFPSSPVLFEVVTEVG